MRHLAWVAIAALACTPATAPSAESEVAAQLVAPGHESVVEVQGDDRRTFRLPMDAGEYLGLEVEQRGVDVYLLFRDGSGELLVVEDSPNDVEGPEPLHFVAEEGGEYQLEVVHQGEGSGSYRLAVETVRSASEQDRDRFEAQGLYLEAQERLYSRRDVAKIRRAIAGFKEALPLFRSLDDEVRVSHTLHAIGHAYGKLGEVERAEPWLEEALELRRRLGDTKAEARTLGSLATGLSQMGRPDEAIPMFLKTIALHASHNDPIGLGTTTANLAETYIDLGQFHRGIEAASESRHWAELAEDLVSMGLAENYLAAAYIGLGDDRRAMKHLDAARTWFLEDEEYPGLPIVALKRGRILERQGETAEARRVFTEALETLAQRYRPGYVQALIDLGLLEHKEGRSDQAVSYLREAVEVTIELGSRREEGRARVALARALMSAQPEEAQREIDVGVRLAGETGDELGRVEALLVGSELRRSVGDMAGALRRASKAADQALSMRRGLDWEVIRAAEGGDREEAAGQPRAYRRFRADEMRARHFVAQRSVFEPLVGLLVSLSGGESSAAERALSLSESARSTGLPSLLTRGEVPGPPEVGTVAGIRNALGEGAVLIELLLGDSESFIWMLGEDFIEVNTLPSRTTLERDGRIVGEQPSHSVVEPCRRGGAGDWVRRC